MKNCWLMRVGPIFIEQVINTQQHTCTGKPNTNPRHKDRANHAAFHNAATADAGADTDTSNWQAGQKALRQTCKRFKEALDGSLTHITLRFQDKDKQHVGRLLRRMQHLHGVGLVTSHHVNSLLKHLPQKLRKLSVYDCRKLNLEPLGRLSCLTDLILENIEGTVVGLQALTGLTSLHCWNRVGSLAHLAPMLKCLSTMDCNAELHLEQLTNLESLRTVFIPDDFFKTFNKLPLKHLYLEHFHCGGFDEDASAWQAAPTTLTRLTLEDTPVIYPGVLPSTITHLQLRDPPSSAIDTAITEMPWLKCLDMTLHAYYKHWWVGAFGNLNKLTNLQSLGMQVREEEREDWQREQILSAVPGVARAIDRGVRLKIITDQEEYMGVYKKPYEYPQSAWTIHA